MIPSTEGEPAGLPDAAVLAAAVARMDRVGRGDGGTVDDGDGDGDDCTSDDGGTSDDDQNQDVNQGVDAAQAGGIGEDDDLDDVRFDQDGGRGPMHQVVSDEDLDRMMDLDGGANAGAGLQHAFDIEDGDPADGGPGHGRPPAGCCGRVARRCCPCLPPCYGIGNATVLLPWLYERTGRYGVIGPHWLGLVASSSLLFAASYYYIGRAILVGPFSAAFSVAMTAQCTVTLFMVAFSDPGIVTSMGPHQGGVGRGGGRGGGGKDAGRPTDGRDLSDWRYCDLCGLYQPPKAAHCPDCNVCVDGYDHHCPWMGTCIGKTNMKAFVAFNLSWLGYLIWAVAWLNFLAPMLAVSGKGGDALDHVSSAATVGGTGRNSTAAMDVDGSGDGDRWLLI